MSTGFFHDEKCFWHFGGNYASVAPVGGLVQPAEGGGLAGKPGDQASPQEPDGGNGSACRTERNLRPHGEP